MAIFRLFKVWQRSRAVYTVNCVENMFPQWRLTHITRHDVGKHGRKCHILSSWVQSTHLAHLCAWLPSTALHVANNLKQFVYILQQYLFKIQLQCFSTFIMFSLWQKNSWSSFWFKYIYRDYISILTDVRGEMTKIFFGSLCERLLQLYIL